MYNLRYHIASLVSVFLALALGLVLGGLIVQKGTFSGQPAALVEGLRKEFSDLRSENKVLTVQNKQLSALSVAFVDEWSKDKLTGRTVVIVTNAGRADGLTAARDVIEGSGGSAAVITVLKPDFGLDDESLRAEVTSLAPDAEKPIESIATSLAAEWFGRPAARPLTDALVNAGVISVSGLDKDVQAGGLVNIAAVDDGADQAGIALSVAAKDAMTPSVGAQTPLTNTGVAEDSADRDVAAMDTLGTEVGRYTLTALLVEPATGYYGSASNADALFPPVTLP